MAKINYYFYIVLGLLLLTSISAADQQVLIKFNEFVDQNVIYNPLKAGAGIWYDAHENQSSYNLTGFIVVENTNPNGKTISDIYISLMNTQNITLPQYYAGRNGTFIENDTSSGSIILHIPELRSGENSTFIYSINKSVIRPPLNFSTSYSDTKLLAGDNLTVYDDVQNVFDEFPFQSGNTCIYDINITQKTVPVLFNGIPQDFVFVPSSIGGLDSANVVFNADNKTLNWSVLGLGCLNKTNFTNISYLVVSPHNIPKTTDYPMINSTIRYKLNQTISHLRLADIRAISEAELKFEKKIVKPSDPILYGSNVTWNVTAYFFTNGTNITYSLDQVSLWVSQRNVNGSYTDPNTIDNDTISNQSLNITYNPFVLVNKTLSWNSSANAWLFNYSDVPSPIVWMDVNFTIANDGVQLINRSITRNGKDIYVKEIYLIIGYWLEINKNITSIGNNTYHIRVDVHNKGNQVTPADTVVTIYDFIPSNYNLNGSMVYSLSPWYNTAESENNVTGPYNGTLYQWGLLPTLAGGLNTSFAAGPDKNENTTWSVDYNVTGKGDYNLLDVFVTGLDPQRVDGAGATKTVVVTEIFDKLKSTEGIFATIASVLLLAGLLL